MSIGRPVSGEAAVVGGAGTAAGSTFGLRPAGTTGGAAGFDRGLVVVVVDAAARVVVVVGFGRVVVVVEVDVVVVGGGWTVSTRRKSTPQALPLTRSRATRELRRERAVSDRWWR
ncbi:MAG TPA: hypothetical protein VHL53_20240 [Acidimicrobiia bacterium]|nr:hypothetical protein [Acidimicrobiia bacterium]